MFCSLRIFFSGSWSGIFSSNTVIYPYYYSWKCLVPSRVNIELFCCSGEPCDCNNQGCIKCPANWYSSPPSFLKDLIFFLKISVPFPSSPLDNLPYRLNITEQMILLPFGLFFTWYSSQKPLNYLNPLELEILPQRIW